MTTIDLSKQQTLSADLKAIQQINFTANIDRAEQTTMYFIIEETKETCFRFFARNCESVVILFCFNTILV